MYAGPFYFDTKKIFGKYPEIKLVYFFGSKAFGRAGLLSDYDFAVYFDEKTTPLQRTNIKIRLNVDLMGELKTNNIDIVSLNDRLDPLLKYEIISKRKILYEKQPYRLKIEPMILSEYFDFYTFIDRRND
ncbi:MAG: nucleotidyltransferase domain-containing protein [Microgenomates group bacterium]|nr:nucleotidyltransferase domain-containing protein [Microgenomates group bacterium]